MHHSSGGASGWLKGEGGRLHEGRGAAGVRPQATSLSLFPQIPPLTLSFPHNTLLFSLILSLLLSETTSFS